MHITLSRKRITPLKCKGGGLLDVKQKANILEGTGDQMLNRKK